jgi:hypothetical protein
VNNFAKRIDSAHRMSQKQQLEEELSAAKLDILRLIQHDQYVGEVYSLGYETALVMGGVPLIL